MAPQQIRKILIKVDAGQSNAALRSISSSLKTMSKDVSSVASNFDLVKNALIGFATGQVVTTFTAMADSMQLLNDRTRSLLGSQEQATYAFNQLKIVAQSTNAPIDELAGTFARIAVATKATGLTTQSMIDLTRVLQNSFRLSGATTEEATASTIQFAQALSFGQLRGQELRSVLSQNATLANVFREAIKGSGQDIYKFAEAGGFTTKFVLTALAKEMDNINNQAGTLGQTFGQTMVKAMNEVKVKIGELNQEFSLSSRFAKLMQYILDNAEPISKGLLSIAAGIAAVQVASLAASGTLTAIATALGSIPALIGIGVASITYVVLEFDKVSKVISNLGDDLNIFFLKVEMFFNNLKIKAANYLGFSGDIFKKANAQIQTYIDEILLAQQKLNMGIKESDMEDYYTNMKKLTMDAKSGMKGLKDQVKELQDTAKKLTIDERIAVLNKQFNLGKIEVEAYNKQIEKLTKEKFIDAGPAKLAKELQKVKLESLTREFEDGSLTLKEYQSALNQIKLDKLQKSFDAGKISAADFHRQLVEISGEFSSTSALVIGTDDYVKKIGNTTTMVAGLIENTFDRLGDSLSSWIKDGKFRFADFAQAILDDLNKIIVRAMIIRPLAEGLLNWAGTTGGGGATSGMSGGSFGPANTMSPSAFASGGIVNRTTSFLNSGKPSIMGEAGPEAILPLRRDSSGNLGVAGSTAPVTVNIINNTGAEITQTEKSGPNGSKVLEVIINSKVKEGIASGAFDRSFQQAYGIRRKGN